MCTGSPTDPRTSSPFFPSFAVSPRLSLSLSPSPRVRSCVFVCMPPLFLSFLFFSKALFIASIPLLALYHFHRLAFTTSRVMYRMFLLHSFFSPPFRPSYVCVGKYSSYFTVLSCCPLFFVSFACFFFFYFLGSLSVRFSVCVSGSDWGVFATFLSYFFYILLFTAHFFSLARSSSH